MIKTNWTHVDCGGSVSEEDKECLKCGKVFEALDPACDELETFEYCTTGRCGQCDACYERANEQWDRSHGGGL